MTQPDTFDTSANFCDAIKGFKEQDIVALKGDCFRSQSASVELAAITSKRVCYNAVPALCVMGLSEQEITNL